MMRPVHERADRPSAAVASRPPKPNLSLLLACMIVFAAVVWLYAGQSISTVALIVLSDGFTAFMWLLSLTLLGYGLLQLLRVDARGGLAFTTAAGLGVGVMSLVLCALALAGCLSHGMVVGLEMASAAIGLFAISRGKQGALQERLKGYLSHYSTAPSASHWIVVFAMPALAIAVVGACLVPGLLWRPVDPHPYDVLIYHLQIPREWYELGRMVPLHHNVYSYFPFNTEMHFLAGMYLRSGPWTGMYCAQFMSLSFAVLAVLAMYVAAKAQSDPEAASSPPLGAVLMAVLPWTVMLGCVAYVESLLLLYSALTIAWTLRAIDRGMAIRPMIVAGMMAGLASGVKLNAVPMLLLAVPCAVAGVWIGRRYFARPSERSGQSTSVRKMVVACLAFAAAGMLVLSPWLIRNLVWIGNPIFPLAMPALGHGHFSLDQIERFRIAHSAKESLTSVTAYGSQFFSEVLGQWRFGYILWPMAAVGAFQQRKKAGIWICLILLLWMAVCWIGFTHLISRFFVIAIPVAALLVGQIRWGRLRWLGVAVVIAASLISWRALHEPLSGFAQMGRDGAFGIENLTPMVPDGTVRVEQPGQSPVIMVGDSQAFLHQMPMRRLRYRTVFDLDMTGLDPARGKDVLSSWAGMPIDSLPPGTMVFIDPIELARLSKSYYKVPPLPADIPGPRDRPFVIDPRSLP